jgi:hypothetical protein
VIRSAAATVGLAVLLLAAPAHAAQSYDNCTGFITSLPAVIGTQGVWCMNSDLSTAATSGAGIFVSANNVTIDCNGFKLGNLGGGTATQAYGVRADGRVNVTVRGCNIRGFRIGVRFVNTTDVGGGHLIENNRIEGATVAGILVYGDYSTVRGNLLVDIGGSTENAAVAATGISTVGAADVVGNTVSGVTSSGATTARGIAATDASRVSIRENVIRDVVAAGGTPYGIWILEAGGSVRDNTVLGPGYGGGSFDGTGIYCHIYPVVTRGNDVSGFETPYGACGPNYGNLPEGT